MIITSIYTLLLINNLCYNLVAKCVYIVSKFDQDCFKTVVAGVLAKKCYKCGQQTLAIHAMILTAHS